MNLTALRAARYPERSAYVPKEKGEMQSSAAQHIFVTGACGAGKSTLAKALSHQLHVPLHRLDDDPDFRQMLPDEPWLHRVTDPQRYARWQALRRHVVEEAVKLHQPYIIEGTHILTAPELTNGHRRILVDTSFHQIIRQSLARDRAKYAEDPARYADRDAGAPGSVAARQRAVRARQIYESLRPELDAFRHLPGVEIVPSRTFITWLPQQGSGKGSGSGLAS
jgi:tRNA A37 N6-isopentenylltransferase MiaA